jgi:hypothetical protein
MRTIGAVAALVGLLAAGCADATVGRSQNRQSDASVNSRTTSTRLVGLGHAAIAVPDDWATNAARCGTPIMDTVVIDVAAVPGCLAPRPKGVESVEISEGEPYDFSPDEMFTVDGVRAQRQVTTCAAGGFGSARVCSGAVYIPSRRVSFRAESTSTAADVGRVLRRIHVLPDRVAVPGYQIVASDHQEHSGEKYVEALRQVGLKAQVWAGRRSAFPAGFVLDARPAPGTMLRPGAVVQVSVAPERRPG